MFYIQFSKKRFRCVKGLEVILIDVGNFNQAEFHKWVQHIFKKHDWHMFIFNLKRVPDISGASKSCFNATNGDIQRKCRRKRFRGDSNTPSKKLKHVHGEGRHIFPGLLLPSKKCSCLPRVANKIGIGMFSSTIVP